MVGGAGDADDKQACTIDEGEEREQEGEGGERAEREEDRENPKDERNDPAKEEPAPIVRGKVARNLPVQIRARVRLVLLFRHPADEMKSNRAGSRSVPVLLVSPAPPA